MGDTPLGDASSHLSLMTVESEPPPGTEIGGITGSQPKTDQKPRWRGLLTFGRKNRGRSRSRKRVQTDRGHQSNNHTSILPGSVEKVNPEVQRIKDESALKKKVSVGSNGLGKRASLFSRPRSASSNPKKGRRRRKRAEAEEKERRRAIDTQMRQMIGQLTVSIATKDKELFLDCFLVDGVQIGHPVGILSESDPGKFFDNFVQVFHTVLPETTETSLVMDYNRLALHVEAQTVSQYTGSAESTRFVDSQHWHIDFGLSSVIIPKVLDNESNMLDFSELRQSSDISGMTFPVPMGRPQLRIKRWHVYSSISRTEKLTPRTFNDTYAGVQSWLKWTSTYGWRFTKAHFLDGFSTEKVPNEVEVFCKALTTLQVDELENLMSPTNFKGLVVSGLFDFIFDSSFEEEVSKALQLILQRFSKLKLKTAHCDSAFRCGSRISARLVLNVRNELLPAFLLISTSEKKSGKTGRIREFLFCTPSTI